MTNPQRRGGRPATGHDPVRSFRVSDDIWNAFVRAAGPRHVEVHRALLAWYAGIPGARRPQRPVGVIYAIRIADEDQWWGEPDLLPDGEYRTGTMEPKTKTGNRFDGELLDVRYGDVPEDTPVSHYNYFLAGGKLVKVTERVHDLLMAASQ